MATVKPYIITVKYVAVYSSRPTMEEVANEINVDAIDISIEEAVVSAKPTFTELRPVEPASKFPEMPAAAPTSPSVPVKAVVEGDLNLYGLERNGTSEKVLRALKLRGPLTVGQLKEVTKLKSPNINVTVNRLKKMSKIKVVGRESSGSVYGIVE
jgi:hypothetical protein